MGKGAPHPLEQRAHERLRLFLRQRQRLLRDGEPPPEGKEGSKADVIAAECGINQAIASKLLRGDRTGGGLREIARVIAEYGVSPAFFFGDDEPGDYRAWVEQPTPDTPWERAVRRYCDHAPVSDAHRPALLDPRQRAPGDADLVRRLHEGLRLRDDGDDPGRSTVRPREG